VIRDSSSCVATGPPVAEFLERRAPVSATAPHDMSSAARCLGFSVVGGGLDASVSPRGYRLLSRIPRLPSVVIDRLVDQFGTLQALLSASLEDLMTVDGVGEGRARAVREGLSRLAEACILERYV